jgi:hypothetical protein
MKRKSDIKVVYVYLTMSAFPEFLDLAGIDSYLSNSE